jgi:tetratricopeptide (TPR) repeat protein
MKFSAAIFISFLLVFKLPLMAQVNTDSLRHVILLQKDPAKKATLLIDLCNQFKYTNPDSLFAVAQELYQFGKQNNNEIWKVTSDIFTATYYNLSGNSDTALTIVEKNIALIADQKKETLLFTKLYSLAGLCLMRLNRQKEALQMFYSCLSIAETINDNETQFKSLNNIGWAFMELEQFEKAITNFTSSLNFIHRNNLPDRYGTIYNNLASCYGSIGQFDSVYKYAGIGIQIAEKYMDYSSLANGYSIIGTFMVKQNRDKEALDNFQKAVSIREKVGDPFYIVSDLVEIADLQSKTGNPTEAIITGQKALDIATKNNIDAKFLMIYNSLSNSYEQSGNYQEAAAAYKKLNALKDSLYKDANPKALAEIQTKYETVKKEQKIEQQQNKLRFQSFLFIGIAGLILLAGLLIHSQYKRYRLKQETKLKTEMMKQQELATKAVIEAEENERQRIAKDLHDGVGQMMSAAKMNLSAFESEITFTNNEQKKSYEKIIQLVDDGCKEVRHVSHNMMPNALLKNNLADAIQDFIDKLDNKAMKVHLYTEGLDERLDANVEIVLYRMIQECVNNVIKHAGATTLDISLIRDKDGISATIEDNGKGFDTADDQKFEGIGLKNINTRIEYLKGKVDFDSAPGRGTVVALHVPSSI